MDITTAHPLSSAQTKLEQAQQLLALDPQQAATSFDRLSLPERLELVLALPAGPLRQNLILRSTYARELTCALTPEDYVVTVKAIGERDALALINLSSDEQHGYLLDLDLWIEDKMDLNRFEHWLELLFECGDERVMRWVKAVDFEQLVFVCEQVLLSTDRDALAELPDHLAGRVFTPDNFHFLLIKVGANYTLFSRLLDLLYTEEQELFLALVGNLGTTPPSEIEELAARFKEGRLADRGWPEWEEAARIYQPLIKSGSSEGPPPIGLKNPPRYPLQLVHSGRLLQAALERIEDPQTLEVLASQLANLVNRVLVADHLERGNLESMKLALERTTGALEIGLSVAGLSDPAEASAALRGRPLVDIFRTAQGKIRSLAERAAHLASGPGGDLLQFVASPLPERFEALQSQRPRYFDDDTQKVREFAAAADLVSLERDLLVTDAMLSLGAALGLSAAALPDPFPKNSFPESKTGLTLETLLLTRLARDRLQLPQELHPFPVARLPELFEALPRDEPALQRSLIELTRPYLPQPLAGLDALIERLARLLNTEIFAHDPTQLDPRFVYGLWLQS
jgi:hypothetical protein